jgi:hypothetical protein
VWLTDGNDTAWGRLGLNGVDGTGRGCRGTEAAVQCTRTGVGATASDQRSGFGHRAGGFGQELSEGGFYTRQTGDAMATALHSQ